MKVAGWYGPHPPNTPPAFMTATPASTPNAMSPSVALSGDGSTITSSPRAASTSPPAPPGIGTRSPRAKYTPTGARNTGNWPFRSPAGQQPTPAANSHPSRCWSIVSQTTDGTGTPSSPFASRAGVLVVVPHG